MSLINSRRKTLKQTLLKTDIYMLDFRKAFLPSAFSNKRKYAGYFYFKCPLLTAVSFGNTKSLCTRKSKKMLLIRPCRKPQPNHK